MYLPTALLGGTVRAPPRWLGEEECVERRAVQNKVDVHCNCSLLFHFISSGVSRGGSRGGWLVRLAGAAGWCVWLLLSSTSATWPSSDAPRLAAAAAGAAGPPPPPRPAAGTCSSQQVRSDTPCRPIVNLSRGQAGGTKVSNRLLETVACAAACARQPCYHVWLLSDE
jgi:hypothetical protein